VDRPQTRRRHHRDVDGDPAHDLGRDWLVARRASRLGAWAKIMGSMALIFGGFGMIMAISEHGFPTIWRALTGG